MDNSSHIDDGNLCLSPREEKFSLVEKLKRSEMDGLDASLWEELCITASENEQQNDSTLLDSEELKQEVSRYKSLKLKADEHALYPNKSSLKKSSHRISLWAGVAAAAIALLIAAPAILQNGSSDVAMPQAVATLPAANKAEKQLQEQVSKNEVKANNNPAIAQANSIAVKPTPKVEVKASAQNSYKRKSIEAERAVPKTKRESLGLTTLVAAPQATAIAVDATQAIEPQLPVANQDVIVFASSDELRPIAAEKAGFLDRLREKGIVNVNKLLGQGTMVVKEYDSNGKLTLYAVQSNTLSFEKEYTDTE